MPSGPAAAALASAETVESNQARKRTHTKCPPQSIGVGAFPNLSLPRTVEIGALAEEHLGGFHNSF